MWPWLSTERLKKETHWSGTLIALYGCHRAGVKWNWCHLGEFFGYASTMHQSAVSVYSKLCKQGTCMLSCSLPPAFLSPWQGSFTCYCGKTGWKGYWNRSWLRKLILVKNILPLLPLGTKTVTFQPRVWCSTTELPQLPHHCCMQYNVATI